MKPDNDTNQIKKESDIYIHFQTEVEKALGDKDPRVLAVLNQDIYEQLKQTELLAANMNKMSLLNQTSNADVQMLSGFIATYKKYIDLINNALSDAPRLMNK